MRTIEEIENLLLLMGKEMFYVQQQSNKLWWAMVDDGHTKISGIYTYTSPIYTAAELSHGYYGIYLAKEEALNAALDSYINKTNGETK